MKSKLRLIPFAMILAALLLYGGISCASVCDEATAICGVEIFEPEEGECTGVAECNAECIIDSDTCDVTDTDLDDCITDCAGE